MLRGTRVFVILSAFLALAMLPAVPGAAQGYTPGFKFLDAVKKKDIDAVMKALNEPGSTIINARDLTSGETALHVVVGRRDKLWTEFLLQHGADPNIKDKHGVTPLVLAVHLGFIDGVDALIRGGAQVDIPNDAGETPLIAAVHQRDIPLIRALLQAGADPDRSDNSGRSARDYATLDSGNSQLLVEIEKHAKPSGERAGSATYGPSL